MKKQITTKNQEIIYKAYPSKPPTKKNAFYIKKEYIRTLEHQKLNWILHFILILFALILAFLSGIFAFIFVCGYIFRGILQLIMEGKRDKFMWYDVYLTTFEEWDLNQ